MQRIQPTVLIGLSDKAPPHAFTKEVRCCQQQGPSWLRWRPGGWHLLEQMEQHQLRAQVQALLTQLEQC